jgi:hypothetical protein
MLRVITTSEASGRWKTMSRVVDVPDASAIEATEQGTHIALSFMGHTNNCKY